MDHDTMRQVIINTIEQRQHDPEDRGSEDFDIDAIAAEVEVVSRGLGNQELDPGEYWQIIEKHARA